MLDADGQGLVITNSTFAAKISDQGILKITQRRFQIM